MLPSRAAAEVARGALEAHGIDSVVVADDGGGVGGLSLTLDHQGAEVRVAPDDWEEAREVLDLPSGGSGRDA